MNTMEKLAELRENARGYWAERIAGELQYLQALSSVQENAYQGLLDRGIGFLYDSYQKNGAIVNGDAQKCEEMLLPAAEAAKKYTLYCVGHAHIDMNWMWGYNETVAVAVDTFRTVLRLMKEYPQFTFSQSQASTYRIVEEYDPQMFDEIRQRVKEGRWEITACSWVEGDKNMASGESLVRQILCAKEYFKEKFDVDYENIRLDFEPDTFGHNASMPEILNKGGVKYYYHCRGDERNDIYNWQAASGQSVLVFREPDWYNAAIHPDMLRVIPSLCSRNHVDFMLKVYGVGDHGGGPTRRDIERLTDMGTWPIAPAIEFSTYTHFFDRLAQVRDRFPTVEGELNYVFTGCYSTQARIKTANRTAEDGLYAAEAATALSSAFTGGCRYGKEYRRAWEIVSFNQFHDILPGSGVRETREHALGEIQKAMGYVYAGRAKALYELAAAIDTSSIPARTDAQSCSEGAGVGFHNNARTNSADGGQEELYCSEQGGGKTRIYHVFNPSQYDRDEVMELVVWDYPGKPERMEVVDVQGQIHDISITERGGFWSHRFIRLIVHVKVPALGYATYVLREKELTALSFEPIVTSRVEWFPDTVMENELVRAEFDSNMQLISLTDKANGRNLVNEKSAYFKVVYQNHRTGTLMHGNAWAEGITTKEVNINEEGHVFITARGKYGDLRSYITYTVKYGPSCLNVTVTLDRGANALRFQYDCDWKEPFADELGIPALKFSAPFAYAAKEYTYKAPLEYITREAMNHDAPSIGLIYACGEDESGLLLLSNCIYAYHGENNAMEATILRASQHPDKYPADGLHTGTFELGICRGDAASLQRRTAILSYPLYSVTNTSHTGNLPLDCSFIRTEGELQVTAVKPPEEEGEGLVIRVVNLLPQDTEGKIRFRSAVKSVDTTDILERTTQAHTEMADAHTVCCRLRPCELLTLHVTFE